MAKKAVEAEMGENAEVVKAVDITFYDAEGNLISDSVNMVFDSEKTESAQREQKHQFIFKNQLSRLNGQEVVLRMERPVPNSGQYTTYKEVSYIVKVMFQAEW